MKNENLIDTVLLSVGSLYSLANIEHILGIVLLIFQIAWIVGKFIIKFIKSNKEEQEQMLEDVVESLKERAGESDEFDRKE